MDVSKTRLSWALPAFWIGVAVTTTIGASIIAYAGAVNMPVIDEWLYTNPRDYLQSLFVKHNDHPFVIGRIMLALDYWLFDARTWPLRLATFLLTCGIIRALAVLGRVAGLRSLQSQIILCAFAATALYNPQGYSNFVWGFQFSYMLAFVTAASAFAALATYAERANRSALFAAFVLAFLASQSFANGAIAPPLLLLMAWRLKLPKHVVLGFVALTALCWLLFALMPGRDATGVVKWQRWSEMIVYALRVIGGASAMTLSLLTEFHAPRVEPLEVALIIGILITALALPLCAAAFLQKQPDPGRLGAACLAAFALGSAALVGISRIVMGADSSLASRYTLISATLIGATSVLVASYFPNARPRLATALLFVAAMLALVIPTATAPLARSVAEHQRAQVSAQTAIIVGAHPRAPRLLHITSADFAARIADLKAHGKWLFHDRWSRMLGQPINTTEADHTICIGDFAPGRVRRGVIPIEGHMDSVAALHGRIIVVVDDAHIMRGYGLAPRTARDLTSPLLHQRESFAWSGAVTATPQSAVSNYALYLATTDRLACRLRAT